MREYGKDKKNSYEYAEEADLSYVNKILEQIGDISVIDKSGKKYKSPLDNLRASEKVLARTLTK